MIAAAIIATALAAAPLDEAAHALAAGRTDQARLMIAKAVAAGESGDAVERLLADLAYASDDWPRALAAYRTLLHRFPGDAALAEKGGLAALKAGEIDQAIALLDRAARQGPLSWGGWNARGAAADLQGDWTTADRSYANALDKAPDQPAILNNLGWSRLLRGDWQGAVEPIEQAAQLAPANAKIAANLDFARSAIADSLPERRPGESGAAWAARLNDAGVAAARQGDKGRAIAAFAQALEANDRWYVRAANNLAMIEGRQ